ncbi:MAG: hypothetical protein ACLFUU_06225 [Desulfobacteraceae bacterium]
MEGSKTHSQLRLPRLAHNLSFLLYGIVFIGVISLIVFLDMCDSELRKTYIKEGGPIELPSAVGYFICLAMLFFPKAKDLASRCCIMFILLLFGLRELDFHVKFTPMNMEKIQFYLSPEVPVAEKLIGVVIIVSLLGCLFYLAKRHALDYIKALKKMEEYALGVFFGILFLVFAKTLDGLQRNLAFTDFTITREVIELTTVIEEVLELGAPVMFMIAIMAFFHRLSFTRN